MSVYNTQFLKKLLIEGEKKNQRLMQLIWDVVCSFSPRRGAVYKVNVCIWH